jgi:hypothetical protein
MKVEIRHTFESAVDVYAVDRLLKANGYDMLLLPPSPLPLGPIRDEVAGLNVITYRDGYEKHAERIRAILDPVVGIDDVKSQDMPSLGLPKPKPGMPSLLNLINEEIVIYLNRVA